MLPFLIKNLRNYIKIYFLVLLFRFKILPIYNLKLEISLTSCLIPQNAKLKIFPIRKSRSKVICLIWSEKLYSKTGINFHIDHKLCICPPPFYGRRAHFQHSRTAETETKWLFNILNEMRKINNLCFNIHPSTLPNLRNSSKKQEKGPFVAYLYSGILYILDTQSNMENS